MNYKISKKAGEDLENIWLYTLENWSLEQADRYISLLFEEIEYLCKKPNSGVDYTTTRKGYFCSKVKSHLIFYKINISKNELQVIRILHERMNLNNHLI